MRSKLLEPVSVEEHKQIWSSFHCSHGGAALQVLLYQSHTWALLLKNAADLVPLCIYQALQQPTVIATHSVGLNLTSQEVIVDDLP